MIQSTTLKKIGYGILILSTILGGWATLSVLWGGHGTLATTQHVPWGLWVALYIYFLGLSAGSFLLSTLIYVFGVKRLEPAGPLALLQALLCLLVGGFLIFMDLGHPFRVHNILLSMNFTSVMAWMGFFYNFYILIVLAELYIVMRPKTERDTRRLKTLGILGIPVAIIVHGGVGAIFAVAKARPNWFGGTFPILFLVSALASGGALLTLLTAILSRQPREKKMELVRDLARLSVGILAVDVLILVSELLTAFYGNVPHEMVGWRLTLFGPYWWVFWFVQLLLGVVIPVWIVLHRTWGKTLGGLGLAGFLVAFGILGTRLNIVIPPQIEPQFHTLPDAYHHMRYAWGYFPSMNEWLVGLFAFSVCVWLFIGALKYLPLGLREGEGA